MWVRDEVLRWNSAAQSMESYVGTGPQSREYSHVSGMVWHLRRDSIPHTGEGWDHSRQPTSSATAPTFPVGGFSRHGLCIGGIAYCRASRLFEQFQAEWRLPLSGDSR